MMGLTGFTRPGWLSPERHSGGEPGSFATFGRAAACGFTFSLLRSGMRFSGGQAEGGRFTGVGLFDGPALVRA
jgi:hypothetical protein